MCQKFVGSILYCLIKLDINYLHFLDIHIHSKKLQKVYFIIFL